MPSARRSGRPYRRTRHIPVPPAAAPSSLTALLTRSTHLGDLQGGQYRARRRLSGLATRRSKWWVSQFGAMASAKARFEHPCSRANSGSSRARPDPIWPMARRPSLDIPVSRPGLMASPRRIRGGTNTVPDCDWVGSFLLCWPLRGTQNGGCPNMCSWVSQYVTPQTGARVSASRLKGLAALTC